MKSSVVSALLVLLAVGCDLSGEKQVERENAARQAAEDRRRAEERDSFAKSMTEYANGRLKLVQERMTALSHDLGAWRADVERFSEIMRKVREAKTSQGKDPTPETCLLNLIRDPEVNVLARRHLAADFTGEQGEFIERVRSARESEAAYRKARTQSEANYESMIRSAQKWVNATAEQRNAEIDRLQSEVAALERKRANLHKSLQGALSEKVRSAERDLAALTARRTSIQECLLAIPVSDLAELRQIRAKLER